MGLSVGGLESMVVMVVMVMAVLVGCGWMGVVGAFFVVRLNTYLTLLTGVLVVGIARCDVP